MEEKKEKNKARGKRESAKRQHAMKSSFIRAVSRNVSVQYLRELLLSSETIERIHN